MTFPGRSDKNGALDPEEKVLPKVPGWQDQKVSIVPSDPFRGDGPRLTDLPLLMTIVGGKVVYEKEGNLLRLDST